MNCSFFFHILFFFVAGLMDFCQDFGSFKSRLDSLNCVRSVPFNESIFNEIIESYTIQREDRSPLIDYQIFHEINKYSGFPFFLHVNLFDEMNILKNSKFNNWFDAMDGIWKAWASFRDVHTNFFLPDVFQTFTFFHPISVFPVYSETTKSLRFRVKHNIDTTSIFDSYNQVFATNINFTNYDGWIINKINGVKPVQFFKDFARNEVFFNRNIGANFNELVKQSSLNSLFRFYVRSKKAMPIPQSSITYDIEHESTGKKEILSNIDFLSCFWNGTNCILIKDKFDLINRVFHNEEEKEENDVTFQLSYPVLEMPLNERKKLMRKYEESNDVKLLCKDEKKDFFSLFVYPEDLTIGIFQVTGEGNYDDFGNVYAKEVIRCVNSMKLNGIKKLVLDIRYNGGGMPRLSHLIASALSRITFPDPGVIQTPVLSTIPTYSELTDPKLGYFDFMIKGLFPKFFPDHPQHEMVLPNNIIKSFSPLYILDILQKFSYPNIKKLTDFEGFEPEDIIVLSHGAAVSAGGELFKFLQLTKSAKIGVIGGFPDLILEGACVDSGLTVGIQVSKYNALMLTMACVFPNHLDSVYDKSFVDFTKFFELQEIVEPDIRYFHYLDLGIDNLFSDQLFTDLKKDFERCFDWNIRVNNSCNIFIENGVFGNPCIDGKYSSDVCVLKRCSDGYYMNKDHTSCVKIEEAPIYKNWEESFKKKTPSSPGKTKNKEIVNKGYLIAVIIESVMIVLLCCCFCCCFVLIFLICCISGFSFFSLLLRRTMGSEKVEYESLNQKL